MSIKFKSEITLEALNNASTDTDRFLVSDSGNIKYRTGAQLLSDIGGQAVLTNPITGTGTVNYIPKFTGATALGNSVIFDTGTAIGIGTTTPTSRVSIVSTTTGDGLSLKSLVPGLGGYILNCNDSDDSDLFSVFGNVLSSNYSINMGDWQVNIGAPYFQLNNISAFFENTNLGVGVISPSQRLHVEGNARVTGAIYDSSNSPGTNGQILSSTATGTSWVNATSGTIGGGGITNFLAKFTGSTAVGSSIIFDNGTNVGIGTNTPATRFEVNGVITATGGNSTQWNAKQEALVSGTNIKTVNGNSILGSGNLSTIGVHTCVKANGTVTSFMLNGSNLSSITGTANRLYVAPYIPASSVTSSSLFINISVQVAATSAKIVIYSNNNGVPGNKIYESTSLDCSTTGIKTVVTAQTFTAGTIYWVGVHSSGTQSYWGAPIASLIPLTSLLAGTQGATLCFTTSPFGTAPSSFGTPIYNNSVMPFVGINI